METFKVILVVFSRYTFLQGEHNATAAAASKLNWLSGFDHPHHVLVQLGDFLRKLDKVGRKATWLYSNVFKVLKACWTRKFVQLTSPLAKPEESKLVEPGILLASMSMKEKIQRQRRFSNACKIRLAAEKNMRLRLLKTISKLDQQLLTS